MKCTLRGVARENGYVGQVESFVEVAEGFRAHIDIRLKDKLINAKSIMGVLSLSVHKGQALYLVAKGEDAQQAIAALCAFFDEAQVH